MFFKSIKWVVLRLRYFFCNESMQVFATEGYRINGVDCGKFLQTLHFSCCYECGVWWLSGKFDAFRPEGRMFEFHYSRRVGTLGKSFTRTCL